MGVPRGKASRLQTVRRGRVAMAREDATRAGERGERYKENCPNSVIARCSKSTVAIHLDCFVSRQSGILAMTISFVISR